MTAIHATNGLFNTRGLAVFASLLSVGVILLASASVVMLFREIDSLLESALRDVDEIKVVISAMVCVPI